MNISLQNLIPSPSAEGTGWSGTYSTEQAYVGNYSLKLVGTTSSLEITVPTTATIPLINTHIYYARVYGYHLSGSSGSVGFYWPIAEPNFREGIALGAAGQWNLYSARNGRTSFSDGSYQFRLDFNNNKVSGTMYYDGVMLIDLTAAFGAGNEPTQAWCDENIPFFEGTLDIVVIAGPVILAAAFSINPANINQQTILSVSVSEEIRVLKPLIFYSGDLYAGEA